MVIIKISKEKRMRIQFTKLFEKYEKNLSEKINVTIRNLSKMNQN